MSSPASAGPCPRHRDEEAAMPALRVHNLSLSLDGYAAGPDQGLEAPLGVGGERLHEWMFATAYGRAMIGEPGGSTGPDEDFLTRGDENVGATIMGRNMFGPVRGPWGDSDWTGWWGDEPPTTTRSSSSPTTRTTRSRRPAGRRSSSYR